MSADAEPQRSTHAAVWPEGQRRWYFLIALALTVVGLGLPPRAALGCVGDCTGLGAVNIADLVTGVNIVLNILPESACSAFENAQGKVDIAQLIQGVNNALNGCADATVTLTGSCAAPGTGSHSLKPCDPGTPITVFRCDDRTQCLHQPGLAMLTATTVGSNGGWSVQVPMADASAALIFQASITNALVYRALSFGTVGGAQREGVVRNVSFAPADITPVTEAAIELLDGQGFENYSDTGAQEVVSAVEQATGALSFAGLTPDAAAALALNTASNNAQVMMVLLSARNTPTPSATSTATPSVTPTPPVSPTPSATGTRTLTATPCTGNFVDHCKGDDKVLLTITDLVHGVGSAVNGELADECEPLDEDQNGDVTGEELSLAVISALTGCASSTTACDEGAIIVSSSPPPSPTPGNGPIEIGSAAGLPGSTITFNVTLNFPPAASTLAETISATDTTIPIAVASAFPSTPPNGSTNAGSVQIGNEIITYTGVSGSSLTGAGRGVGTTSTQCMISNAPGCPAVHPIGATVTLQGVAGTLNDIAFDAETPIIEGRACSVDGSACKTASNCAAETPPQTCDPTGAPACSVNPSIHKPGRTFAYEPSGCCSAGACPGSCTSIRGLVLSPNNTDVIPTGSDLYTCSVMISSSAAIGQRFPLTCSNAGWSDPTGSSP